MKKSLLKGVGLAVAAAVGLAGGVAQAAKDPIIVGSILDETGPLNIYGAPMADATRLAIEHINENGGVLGRPLKLVSYDAQSDNAKYTQYATRLAMRDRAEVIMGGITSASREAIRPVVKRTGTLYFYNEQYEGGVCDKNVFLTGIVPSQQLAPLVPWAVENLGPKVYVLAADYNYGHISTDWVKEYVKEAGGQVVGADFIPLSVAEFGSVVNKLQDAKPDVVLSLLVGGNHIAFYRQFAAAGLGNDMTIVSPTFGLGNEQVVLSPKESKNVHVAYPYFQSLDNPTNKQFVDMWHEAYGKDYPYITDSAVTVWNGWHLWAKAVEKAGTTDRDAVIKALESGVSFDSPSGKVQIDGGSHHLIQSVNIAKANDAHGFDLIVSEKMVPPAFEQKVCNLIENPRQSKQYQPGEAR
jgi:urea transport system substrate-binding protein